MNKKKLYIWKLAAFLTDHRMTMSGEELADHLNRNNFLTSYGATYKGGRGTYKLIKETWSWLQNDLNLEDEADKVAIAFVKPNGEHAYK
ncbi:MAG: hypothetical protein QNK23_16300 [Crocinitomicaceae bacterium]|nr:hypothetical protein [Crocinitomicaceae bacterium]